MNTNAASAGADTPQNPDEAQRAEGSRSTEPNGTTPEGRHLAADSRSADAAALLVALENLLAITNNTAPEAVAAANLIEQVRSRL